MNKAKRNLIISWLICSVAIAVSNININLSLITILIAYPFRNFEQEKSLLIEFVESNKYYFSLAKKLTLLMSLIVLIYTLVQITNNPESSAALPGFWSIMLILSPIFAFGLLHELHLFKRYSKNA